MILFINRLVYLSPPPPQMDANVLTLEMTETLMGVLPGPDDIAVLKNYSSPDNLDKASGFYWHLASVPRLEQRLQCHAMGFK